MKHFYLIIVALAIIAACQTNNEEEDLKDGAIFEAECTTDADCSVGGCSSQVCTTAEEAPGLITTCEYREEYSCLQFSGCGCIEGKCGWAQTEEYQACLANLG